MRFALSFLVAVVVWSPSLRAQQAEPVAVIARRVLDGAGRQIDNGAVVVEGNRITSVGQLPSGFRGRRFIPATQS